ncbi:MAG: inositol monophosphatase [Phycisphaerales bacterium]|jgi:myo-inositol-1(or 4)-monophosphatase|nr:inositol monophosphatase [Phycisphaerales bacterium]
MSEPPAVPAPRGLVRLQRAVARLVADIGTDLVRARARLRAVDVRRKGVGDFVTTLDLRAERRLRRTLAQWLPTAGFLGEETPPHELDRDLVWVVDPIDGTSNFANGLPHFAVAVALLAARTPVLAAIHAYPEDATYTARAGGGARRNGRRLRCPDGQVDDGGMIGCQWFRGASDLAFVERLQRGGSRVRTFGSTVTQLLDVATGRLDANCQQQGRIWDFVAAGLVVQEAGGRLTDWRGRPLFPLPDLQAGHVPTLAAAANVHPTLCRWLRGCPLPASS